MSPPQSPPPEKVSTTPPSNSTQTEDAANPPPALTPSQSRLHALRAKEAALTATLTQLTHHRTLLLLRLHAVLPESQTRSLTLSSPRHKAAASAYTPSTAAHTTRALPALERGDQDALMGEANALIKRHIGLLHGYNEIKDAAQGLIGMIADQRDVRVVDCQGEFGVGPGD